MRANVILKDNSFKLVLFRFLRGDVAGRQKIMRLKIGGLDSLKAARRTGAGRIVAGSGAK